MLSVRRLKWVLLYGDVKSHVRDKALHNEWAKMMFIEVNAAMDSV